MGVLGLTPFIQKTIPQAIKVLPDRLKGLSGKKIVFDGTLITQRLHFAQLPHPYRHVLGWYRILKELQDHDVEAICIFDGKERSFAKAKEALRRKEAQRLVNARGLIEGERLNRLVQLQGAFNQFDWDNVAQRIQLSERLNAVASATPEPPEVPMLKELDWFASQFDLTHSPTKDIYALPDVLMQEEGVLSSLTEVYDPRSPFTQAARDSRMLSPTATNEPKPIHYAADSKHVSEEDIMSMFESTQNVIDMPATPYTPFFDYAAPTPSFDSPDAIAETLVSLYQEYNKSISKVTSVSRAARATSDSDSDKTEYEMSRGQYQLTKDEGELWNAVAISPAVSDTTPKTLLSTLKTKSFLLSESYKRRAHPPTAQTYSEAKEIIAAMGVPCIEVEGAFEAEGLASSLVLNGVADYVASEDTDVLVYGAPLIRNISNRRDSLTCISSADIGSMLNLSHEMFIDFALLLGTDFTQRIKNVGPARALKFIRTHGSIEEIVKSETKYPPSSPLEEYLQQIDAGRKVFQTLPPVPEVVRTDADETKISHVMGKYGLSNELEEYWENPLEGNYFSDNPSNSNSDSGFVGF